MSWHKRFLSKALVEHTKKIQLLLLVASVVWFMSCAHKANNKQTYVSENALLPGNADHVFNGDDVQFFGRIMPLLKSNASRDYDNGTLHTLSELDSRAIQASILRVLELEYLAWDVSVQSFNVGSELHGRNIYAIWRAPRAEGAEAILMSAPIALNGGYSNSFGIAMVLSLMRAVSRSSFYSKDVVVVFPEHRSVGMQAWIQGYLGLEQHTSISSDQLQFYSGSIQAGLNLEMGSSHHYDSVGVVLEGTNGQMPNLDLFNALRIVAANPSGLHLHDYGEVPESFVSFKKWLYTLYHDVQYHLFLDSLWNILWTAKRQAIALPTHVHGVLLRYRIDALTLTGVPTAQQSKINVWNVASVVEGTMRSVNNLLEHFHQSFFFYFLPAENRYSSIGMYFPAIGFLCAALLMNIFVLWQRSCVDPADLDKSSEAPVRDNDPLTVRTSRFIRSIKHSRIDWFSVAQTLVIVYSYSAVYFFLPMYFKGSPWILVILSCTSLLISIQLRRMYSERVARDIVKMIALITLFTVIASLSVINFSLILACAMFATLRLQSRSILNGFLFEPTLLSFWIISVLKLFAIPAFTFENIQTAIFLSHLEVNDIFFAWIDGFQLFSCWIWPFIAFVWIPFYLLTSIS